MEVSQLTERDRALVELGNLPIDVDPPRAMSVGEISHAQRIGMMQGIDLREYKPLIHLGVICYERRQAGG
jgi:hypothetical protein